MMNRVSFWLPKKFKYIVEHVKAKRKELELKGLPCSDGEVFRSLLMKGYLYEQEEKKYNKLEI